MVEAFKTIQVRRTAGVVALFFVAWSGLAMAAAWPGWEWLRGLFMELCHQNPARCYSVAGQPAGLCVRCLWIYLGLAAGHLWYAWFPLREKLALRVMLAAAALMAADVGLETLGVYDNVKWIRAATGFFFGGSCAWFTLRGLSELFGKSKPKTKLHEFN